MTTPDDLLWQEVETSDGKHDAVLFAGAKHKLKGWVLQDSEAVWVARTVTGTRAEFDNQEDARAFLVLLVTSTNE